MKSEKGKKDSTTLLTSDIQPLTSDHKYGYAQAKGLNPQYDEWIRAIAENHNQHHSQYHRLHFARYIFNMLTGNESSPVSSELRLFEWCLSVLLYGLDQLEIRELVGHME